MSRKSDYTHLFLNIEVEKVVETTRFEVRDGRFTFKRMEYGPNSMVKELIERQRIMDKEDKKNNETEIQNKDLGGDCQIVHVDDEMKIRIKRSDIKLRENEENGKEEGRSVRQRKPVEHASPMINNDRIQEEVIDDEYRSFVKFKKKKEEDEEYEEMSAHLSELDHEKGCSGTTNMITYDTPEEIKMTHDEFEVHVKIVIEGPRSFDELSQQEPKERTAYMEAVDEEKKKMIDYKVYEEMDAIDLPTNAKPIGTRFVLNKKVDDTNVPKYKARLVAKDFKKRKKYEGRREQYFITDDEPPKYYAPVVGTKVFRLLFILAAIFSLNLHQFDINAAFLNATYKDHEPVYVWPPAGYYSRKKVWRLLRPLYGMRDAPREWWIEFREFLISQGFTPMIHLEECLYVKWWDDGSAIFMAHHVDDNMAAISRQGKGHEWWKLFIAEVHKKYGIKDLGTPKWCLGINIMVTNQGIHINQATYIEKAIERFDKHVKYATATPEQDVSAEKQIMEIEKNKQRINREVEEDENELEEKGYTLELYQQMIGVLIYASIMTRPDIAHAVNVLARSMQKPEKKHFVAAIKVFSYLKGTKEIGIAYKNQGKSMTEQVQIELVSDAAYGDDVKDGKTTYGYAVLVNGDLMHWQSKKQSTVATSTTQAEYMGMYEATKEGMWLKQLLSSMKLNVYGKILLKGDNEVAISAIKAESLTERIKHIRIKYHYVRELYTGNEIKIEWVETKENIADIFTKALGRQRYEYLRNKMMKRLNKEKNVEVEGVMSTQRRFIR
jgi:hypothetical protein